MPRRRFWHHFISFGKGYVEIKREETVKTILCTFEYMGFLKDKITLRISYLKRTTGIKHVSKATFSTIFQILSWWKGVPLLKYLLSLQELDPVCSEELEIIEDSKEWLSCEISVLTENLIGYLLRKKNVRLLYRRK